MSYASLTARSACRHIMCGIQNLSRGQWCQHVVSSCQANNKDGFSRGLELALWGFLFGQFQSLESRRPTAEGSEDQVRKLWELYLRLRIVFSHFAFDELDCSLPCPANVGRDAA